jgi:hypothetical protein
MQINLLPPKDTRKHFVLPFDSFGGGRSENTNYEYKCKCLRTTCKQEYPFFVRYMIFIFGLYCAVPRNKFDPREVEILLFYTVYTLIQIIQGVKRPGRDAEPLVPSSQIKVFKCTSSLAYVIINSEQRQLYVRLLLPSDAERKLSVSPDSFPCGCCYHHLLSEQLSES